MTLLTIASVLLGSLLGVLAGSPLLLEPLSGVPPFGDVSDAYKDYNGALQSQNVRLPKSLSPIHYNLRIRPILNEPLGDPTQFTAPGLVEILLKCVTATNRITLHSEEIVIDHTAITVSSLVTTIRKSPIETWISNR
jgi:hypothetical protein